MDLKGKAAVVTGSSSDGGVGAECAKILASRGCNVVVNYATNRAGADKVAADCAAAGVECRRRCRATSPRTTTAVRLVQAAVERWGRLDVLINNAAVTKTIPHQRFDLLDADEFERTYAVNLIGNYQMCRAAAPHLKATGDAAIVNISSIGAMRGSRQLDRLCRLQGRAQHADASAWRARWRRRCGSMRCARAASSAAGRARS